MGTQERLALAIRTIAVSARASIRTNEKLNRPEMAAASARRGLAMLDELGAELSAETSTEVREQYERARREMMSASGESGFTGFTIGDGQGRTGTPPAGGSRSKQR